MNITSLTVYLVMQMNTLISGIVVLLCVISIGAFASGACILSQDFSKKTEIMAKRYLKWALPIIFVLGIMLMVVPNSKTLAAMYVLPKIANSEVIQGEAKELYYFAKEGLRNLVNDNEKINNTEK